MQTEAESFWTQPRDRPALVHLRASHIAAFAAVAAAFVAVALRIADRAEERKDPVRRGGTRGLRVVRPDKSSREDRRTSLFRRDVVIFFCFGREIE